MDLKRMFVMTKSITVKKAETRPPVSAVWLRGWKCLDVSGSVLYSVPAQQSLHSIQMSEATLNLRVV